MPKKKNVTSGFGLLMKELQEKYAREGRRYSMEQMRNYADPAWKAMTAEERQNYNDRAKLCRRHTTAEKLASDGTSIAENEKYLQEVDDQEKQMFIGIRQLIDAYEQDYEIFKANILNQKFYIMSFNLLCCTREGNYVPLEISLAEYSISKGILKDYHKFIFPGPAPLGYTGEAKRHSESSHNINISGHDNSEKNYCKILREIADFLCPKDSPNEEFSPVFTMPEMLQQTIGCLEWICNRAGTESYVKIWDLSYLLYELRNGVGAPLTSKLIAQELLSKNVFDYTVDSRCDFHEELDSPYCTLGYVRRLCYLLSDSLCTAFDVDITDKHLPKKAQDTRQYEILSINSRSSSNLSLSRSNASTRPASSRLCDLDEFSDGETDSASLSSYGAYSQSGVISNALAAMNLNATAPGKGIGRGRPRQN